MNDQIAPSDNPGAGTGPLLWIAGVLLLVVVFIAGLVLGQAGALGGPGTAVVPTASPVVTAAGSVPASTAPPATLPTSPSTGPTAPATPAATEVVVVTQPPGPPATQPPSAPANFGVFWEALSVIRENFVGRDELADTQLTYGAIRGLVEALGDTGHSVFLRPEALQQERDSLSGTIVGVGALLGERGGRPIIVSVISGAPAQRAGLRSGDALIEVDGINVETLDPAEIATRVRGDEGTTVVILIERPATNERLEFSIVREEIRIPAAGWTMIPGTNIALLRLIQFSDGAGQALRTARDEAIAQGAQSFVLDLRSNPGGFVHEAVNVASLFLHGSTVYIRELASGERIPVVTDDSVPASDLPMVVLIDGGTASSAEIVSGGLKSNGRAQLIGETTFGTGTVLITFELSDGSAVRLAIERWLTPDGELIFGQGIAPNEEIRLTPDELPLEPDEVRELTPDQVSQIGDRQLLRAIELLSAP